MGTIDSGRRLARDGERACQARRRPTSQNTCKIKPTPLDHLLEYVLNNTAAWEFSALPGEAPDEQERQRIQWDNHLTWLDTAILSLLGEQEIPEADIAATLDEILSSSLWERRLTRQREGNRRAIKSGLLARAKHVWAQSTATTRERVFPCRRRP